MYVSIHSNVAFGTEENVPFIEVSLVQRCPYRERFYFMINNNYHLLVYILQTRDIICK